MSVFFRKQVFLEPPPMSDGELALVEPSVEVLASQYDAMRARGIAVNQRDEMREYTNLRRWLRSSPRGRTPGRSDRSAPQYTFWMQTPKSPKAGFITLRIGQSEHLRLYIGHIGYQVEEEARGHHYAARACLLVYPLARMHGMHELWITCAPNNKASWRSAELAHGVYVETIDTPLGYFDIPQRARFHVTL
ncbi:MAG: GNAT family N-acetyltransferase [Candidatus Hydrogenedentes bacterium]|nr:GNAT family N-acetyltransferase [Candidatus Hydrogenedentota bacterium]